MNVYRRTKGGPYWFRFTYKGQEVRRSSAVYDKETAKDIASAFRTKLIKGEVGLTEPEPKPAIPTFNAAMKTFLEWSEIEYAARPSSHQRYLTSSKALLRFFGNKPLDKINSDDIERFKTWRSLQKKAPAGRKSKHRKARTSAGLIMPATVNRELALLSHLFNRFESLISHSPCKNVRKLEERNEHNRILNHEEEKRYLMAASQPLRDIATIMLETGMRPEEVCRIQRENVHLEQGYVFNPFGKTPAARRRLFLTTTARNVISRRLAIVKGAFLFPGRKEDRHIVKVNAAHVSAVKRSGVARFRLYDCRHTFATRAVQAGVDLVTLAAILGHSKLNMVTRYAHPTEQHQAAAMQKIQAYGSQ